MPQIIVSQNYISLSDINQAIDFFKKIKKRDLPPELLFTSTKKLLDIDILFVGYLILFKEEIPELKITLKFENNPIDINDTRFEYKLIQYGIYAYLMTGKGVFSLLLGNRKIDFDCDQHKQFPKNWFVLSDNFMLLLLVSNKQPDLFKNIFEKRISDLLVSPLSNGLKEIVWENDNRNLYRKYSEIIIKQANPRERNNCILHLGQLAFYKSLFNAKILPFFLDKEYQQDTTLKHKKSFAGNLSSKTVDDGSIIYEAYNYYEDIKYIFLELSEKPIIHQLIFATLTSSDLLPPRLTQDNKQIFINNLFNLWHFSKDLIHGLKELAKNIQEHASSRTGVITAQVIHQSFLNLHEKHDIKSNSFIEVCRDYFEVNKEEIKNFLNIHVFDLGEHGIIPTLAKTTTDLYVSIAESNPLKLLILEDLSRLKDERIGLADLLISDGTSQLNQQAKRSIAHLGLLTFSNLILKNGGMIKVDSQNQKQERETAIIPEKRILTVKMNAGTSFQICLPIRTHKPYFTHIPHNLYLPQDSSVNEIKGMEELFLFSWIDIGAARPTSNLTGNCILSFDIPMFSVSTRVSESEFWSIVKINIEKYISYENDFNRFLIHLNFDQVQINASQILRFFGKWETEYPKVCLMASNIPEEIFSEVKQLNSALTVYANGVAFWNETAPLIIYNFISDEVGDRFYFTDVFWGKTEEDFLHLNRLIKRNHFNSTSLKSYINDDAAGRKTIADSLIDSKAFYNKNLLLPFDLLIKAKNFSSIFEANASMLLKNEVRLKNQK